MSTAELADRLSGLLLRPDETIKLKSVGGVEAAVLIPIYARGDGLVTVFTERRADLRRHAGEVSFPGGRRDPGEDLRDTALREAEEEIGLKRELVTIVGALPPTPTFVTNYAVYPFVGLIEPGGTFMANPSEVEAVVELGLSDLIAGFERKRLIRRGVPIRTATYTVQGHFIWGATARILEGLLERLRPVVQPS
jgi:8-oxo-dGTP pyrophosphatase MutT (NUDIX family)